MPATIGVNPESQRPVRGRPVGGQALRYRVRFADTDLALIRLEGDLDRTGASDLADALDACAAVDITRVEIDAEQVTFADSHGIHLLARQAVAFRRRGGWLRVVCPSKPVRRVIDLAGVGSMLLAEPGPTGSFAASEVAGEAPG